MNHSTGQHCDNTCVIFPVETFSGSCDTNVKMCGFSFEYAVNVVLTSTSGIQVKCVFLYLWRRIILSGYPLVLTTSCLSPANSEYKHILGVFTHPFILIILVFLITVRFRLSGGLNKHCEDVTLGSSSQFSLFSECFTNQTITGLKGQSVVLGKKCKWEVKERDWQICLFLSKQTK